jgi:hypothetical protein
MMSEGKSTVMETLVKATMVDERMAASEAAGMREAAAMAKSAAMATAATMHGRSRGHRTGCDGRRRGQSDHHFAQHDLSSVCCDEQQLQMRALHVE